MPSASGVFQSVEKKRKNRKAIARALREDRRHPAIDHQGMAGDVGTGVGGEHHQFRGILRRVLPTYGVGARTASAGKYRPSYPVNPALDHTRTRAFHHHARRAWRAVLRRARAQCWSPPWCRAPRVRASSPPRRAVVCQRGYPPTDCAASTADCGFATKTNGGILISRRIVDR